MWNRRHSTLRPDHLRTRIVRERQLWLPAFLGALPRTLFSLAVAGGSLWLVAVTQGFLGVRERENQNLTIVVSPETAGPPWTVGGEPTHADAKLTTYLEARVPRILGSAVLPTKYESEVSDFLAKSGDAWLTVQFWREGNFKIPVAQHTPDDPLYVGHLRLRLYLNRELVENVKISEGRIPATYKRLTGGIGVQPTGFTYIVDCPQRPVSWEMALEFICPMRFKEPIVPSKGLAQFHWRQALLWLSPTAPTRARTGVVYDPEFEDVKLLVPLDGLDAPPKVSNGNDFDYARVASADAQVTFVGPLDVDIRKGELQRIGPVGFSIEGTNPNRKDLADLISFGMAALFGAAAASLFEQASSALRRRPE